MTQIEEVLDGFLHNYLDENPQEEESVRNSFGSYMGVQYSGRNVSTFNQWRSLFVNSAKKAYTIQELNNKGIEFKVTTLDGFKKFCSLEELQLILITARLQGERLGPYAINLSDDIDSFLNRQPAQRKRASYTYIDVNSYYVLKNPDGRYLYKYKRHSYTYSYHINPSGTIFPTKKLAEKYAQKHSGTKWEAVEVNQPTRLRVLTSQQHLYSNQQQQTLAL